MCDYDIIISFNNLNHSHNKKAWFKHHCTQDEYDYIINRFDDSTCFNESLDRILNNIDIRPKCICGRDVEYVGKPNLIFRKYCSNKCRYNDTNLVQRHKEGCLKKYNVENISQVNEIKLKKEKTFLNHYNVKNNFGRIEVKNKIKDIYGVDNISQLDIIKQRKISTCKNNYDAKFGLLLDYAREHRKSPESIKRELETKRKNGTLGASISIEEHKLYIDILEYDNTAIQQYYSPLYPFNCDIYCPKFDLYIEYNGFWTHNGHPYNENSIEDNLMVEQWKNKNTKFYDNAIHNWTVRDVKKRNIAKQNNLNYFEIFNDDDKQRLFQYLKEVKQALS